MTAAHGMNKTALLREKRLIAALKRHVPALDLKRRGLAAALDAEQRRGEALAARLEALEAQAGAQFPMLAHAGAPVERLFPSVQAQAGEERFLGVSLPAPGRVEAHLLPVPRHVFPHWAEPLLRLAQAAVETRVHLALNDKRCAALARAAAKATQRLNLVEQILIPEAESRARAIAIGLADRERAQVVIAKFAKAKLGRAAP